MSCDLGLYGLAVMGQNLILNFNDHGYKVCAFNRTVSKVTAFLDDEAKGTNVVGASDVKEFIGKLKKPRVVFILVKAGPAVDDFIHTILPLLDQGDVVVDGGNSHYPDSIRRCEALESKGIYFIGCGVSGGEEGARYGPSMMPGGHPKAWPIVKDMFQAVSAKSTSKGVSSPCCTWVGQSGSGHFVKMVHNGIEYGDMQLICEVYHCMLNIGMSNQEMSDVFTEWNKTELDSYLIEITADILKYKEPGANDYLVNQILDCAGQKGTGKWTAQVALDVGMPVTLIGEAVFSRCLSALKAERTAASKILPGPETSQISASDKAALLKDLKSALYASKITSYAQGFMLLREAAKEYKWDLNYGDIALMWRGGCIIRSAFLGDITNAFTTQKELSNLLLDPFFKSALVKTLPGWRRVAQFAIGKGIPIPCMSTALSFYDGYRLERLPANLLQGMRDYFGAHTYELLGKEGHFHTNWTGNHLFT
eukprot:NODE_291_length_10603_cov_1.029703.p2 type:complete len:479 gc:universal NODE_291_length_10603_cov_1.029703:1736-3172(+)